ncbi:MAG: hypothetical protein R3F20_16440 [Planctomycetota bacterium]
MLDRMETRRLLRRRRGLILALAWSRAEDRQAERIARLEEELAVHEADRTVGVMQVGELGREALETAANLDESSALLVSASSENSELRNELESLLARTTTQIADLTRGLDAETKARRAAETRATIAEKDARAASQARDEAELQRRLLANSAAELKKEVRSMRERSAAATAEAAAAREEAKAADAARLAAIAKEREERGRLAEEYRRDRAAVARQLEQTTSELARLRPRLEDLEAMRLRSADELAGALSELAETRKLNAEYRKRNAEQFNRLQSLEADMEQRAAAAEQTRKALAEERDALRAKVATLEKTIEELIKSKDEMGANVRAFEREVFTKMAEYPKLVRENERMKAELARRPDPATTANRGDLERQLIAAKAAVARLERETASLSLERDGLVAQRDAARAEIARRGAAVSANESRIAALEKTIEQRDGELERLRRELGERAELESRLRARIAALGGV